MRRARPFRPDLGVVFSVAAAVVAATASQCWTRKASQLESEILGWLLLSLFVGHIRRRLGRINLLPPQPESVAGSGWFVALAVGAATISSAENPYQSGVLLPALTPVLLLMHKKKQQRDELLTFSPTNPRRAGLFGAVAVSLFAIYTLAARTSLLGLALSTVELLAWLAFYATTRLVRPADHCVDVDADLASLGTQVAAVLSVLLALQRLLLGSLTLELGPTLLAGAAKAAAWYFAAETARHSSWIAVPVVQSFAMQASRNPFIQSSERQALSHVVASVLVLAQLVALIPGRVGNRKLLWALVLVPAAPYLANTLAISAATSRAVAFADAHEHPVEAIIRQANADFDELLLRQSRSYPAACDEYRRRHGMEPPPGFEAWFDYAVAHNSTIVDDFDVMYDSIRPFWAVSGEKVGWAMKKVQQSPESEVWTCRFSGQTGQTHCKHPWRTFDRHLSQMFNQLMGHVRGVLPDIEFLVNHLDEPRVMFPAGKHGSDDDASDVRFQDLTHVPTWASLARHCDDNNNKNKTAPLPRRAAVDSYGLPFVQDASWSKDICKHADYRNMHGLLMSPTSFRLVQGMVPVLSTGSPSAMGDILFPSPAYIESEFRYSDEHDSDWSRKKNNVYWAGSTSGAFAKDSQWKHFHRQRLVSLAQKLDGSTKHKYLASAADGTSQLATSSFLNSRHFDVAFTKIFQCSGRPCREQSFFFRPKAWADRDEALRSRLAFDLDGNGISGRWYRLVASKSAPLKQTLLREWHDDRLVPWVHFVPVSQGMEELPELVAYLISTDKGQQRTREIADRGREWFSRALRDVDMGVYVYRLLLELARLQDPRRSASAETRRHTGR